MISATLLEHGHCWFSPPTKSNERHPFGCSETWFSRWFLSGQCAAVSRAPQRPRTTKSVKDVCIICLAHNACQNDLLI